MLDTLMDRYILFYAMGIAGVVGVLCKLIAWWTLHRLLLEAAHMGKSEHPLMKLLKAKFEHTCMISKRVENVKAFVEKYAQEYKVLGIHLHGYHRMEYQAVFICASAGALGGFLTWGMSGPGEMMWRYFTIALAQCTLMMVFYNLSDEEHQWRRICNYMVDYLENIFAHRYVRERVEEICREEAPLKNAEQQEPSPRERMLIQARMPSQEELSSREESSSQPENTSQQGGERQKENQREEAVLRKILAEYLA